MRHEDRYTLLLGGELDLASASSIEELTRELCADGASEIVLDLSTLASIDSAGLQAILESRTLCEEHQCGFCLIPGASNIERLYELDGLVDKRRSLDLVPSDAKAYDRRIDVETWEKTCPAM